MFLSCPSCPADVRSIISLSCVRGDGQPGIQCQLSCLLTGTWLGPGPCYRSHDLAPCVILQLPSHSHQSLPSQAPVQPIREQSSQHLTVGFHCVRAGLVWSLVMGDYSIPGSHTVCVTGESFHHPPPSPPSLSPRCFIVTQIADFTVSIKYQQV